MVHNPALEVSDLSKSVGPQRARTVINNCSCVVPSGVTFALVGPSGAGKSSILHCMAGLDAPDSGSVTVLGRNIYAMGADARTKYLRDVSSLIFQSNHLLPYLTVAENVTLSSKLSGTAIDDDRLASTLQQFGLAAAARTATGVLSGGEQQRVAICRSLYAQSQIVFADEPTGSLDSANARFVFDQLRGISAAGGTVVLVTHDLQLASQCDHIAVVKDGVIVGVYQGLSSNDIATVLREPLGA